MIFAVSGCSKKDDDKKAKNTKKTTAPKSTETTAKKTPEETPKKQAGAAAMTCEKLGCTGKGKFSSMCNCKGKDVKPPIAFHRVDGEMFKKPKFEIRNSTAHQTEWASATVYYYDKDGKQLAGTSRGKPQKAYRLNGSTMGVKANGTRSTGMGYKTAEQPAGTKTVQVAVDGWCYGDSRTKDDEFCVRIDKSPDDRPMAK